RGARDGLADDGVVRGHGATFAITAGRTGGTGRAGPLEASVRFRKYREGTPEARRRLALLVVWLLSLGLRVLFLAGMHPRETLRADAFSYSVLASNLVSHETYSESVTPPFQPYVQKPPGYPVLLAPFFAGRDLVTGAAAAMRAQVLVGSLL